MDIHVTRRKRIQSLIAKRFDGNQAAFSEATGLSPDYVSRLVRGKPPAKGGKNLGERKAREIEARLKLDAGWFDRVEPAGTAETAAVYKPIAADDYPALIAHRIRDTDEACQIAVLNMIEAFIRDGIENGAKRKRRRESARSA